MACESKSNIILIHDTTRLHIYNSDKESKVEYDGRGSRPTNNIMFKFYHPFVNSRKKQQNILVYFPLVSLTKMYIVFDYASMEEIVGIFR